MIPKEVFPQDFGPFYDYTQTCARHNADELNTALNLLNTVTSLLTARIDLWYEDMSEYYAKKFSILDGSWYSMVTQFVEGEKSYPSLEELNARFTEIYKARLESFEKSNDNESLPPKLSQALLPLINWTINISNTDRPKAEYLEACRNMQLLYSWVDLQLT